MVFLARDTRLGRSVAIESPPSDLSNHLAPKAIE